MQTNDITKLNKIMKAIEVNFPNVKIDFCVFSSGEVASCINKNCLAFRNVREFVRALAFLNGAKFTPRALETLKKKKNQKKKNIFFYWLLTCVSMTRNKGKTLEELRQEYYKIYGLEIKQGRKKKARPTECTESGQILQIWGVNCPRG